MEWRTTLIVVASFCPLLQAELLPIKTFTTADGLASDRVDNIVADSRGFLWFCTQEGLSRFDGYRFVTYGVDEGLPHQAVFALAETRSGDHWIGTARGLSRIEKNGHSTRFTNYQLGPDTRSNYVVAVIESRSGRMLAATGKGIIEWSDPARILRREIPALDKLRITDIAEDSVGNLWIATTTGLFVLGGKGALRSFTVREGMPGEWVEELLLDSKGRMWAGIRGGLAQFNLDDGGEWRLANVYTTKNGLVSPGVAALKEASDGTLWIGTSQGINRLKWNAGGRPVIDALARGQGLSDRSVISLAEDQAGNMWAGTESAGVMRIGRFGFTTYREQDGLHSDRVWALTESRAGQLLAVTIPEGPIVTRSVDIFDGTRFRRLALGTFSDHPDWGWSQVLLQSRRGEWWAATKAGMCRYGVVDAAALDRRKPRMCYAPDAEFFRIFEDSKGGIWASAQSRQGDRLMRWNPDTNAVFEFAAPRIPAEGDKSLNDLVSAFAEDRAGNIWMGLYKGGLYRYNSREFRHFDKSDGVQNGPAIALLASASGLWIGADGGGLGHMMNTSGDHPRVELYDTGRGMASNIIQSLVEDDAGHIYAATTKGVDRLDPRSGHIRHFSVADGLAHGAFHGAIRDHAGAIWFATTQGLSRLTPAADPPAVKPRILITNLRVGGAPHPVSALGEAHLGDIELQPSQNQLRIEFAGIDYEPGDIVRYSYKLDGADKDWSAPLDQRSVDYAALASGTYRFLVKAVTSEGAESAAPAEIDFTVLPPFWKRWWFQALALGLAIGLVFAAHRYRVAQAVSLERMRTTIATDLHDDIGASLSQIAILSEVARAGGNGQARSSELLEKVAVLARELVDSMSDIVWSIRLDPHGMDALVRRMREFAFDLLGSQGIEFALDTTHAADHVKLSLQARRQLFLMFKECIHNAARHARCTSVTASLRTEDREVLLTIEDDGIGLAANGTAGDGTGIAGMRRRASNLGGCMEIASSAGEGCLVEIRLPMRGGPLARA